MGLSVVSHVSRAEIANALLITVLLWIPLSLTQAKSPYPPSPSTRKVCLVGACFRRASALIHLIDHCAPVTVCVALLAGPSGSLQLLGDHSIHESMTEQQDRSCAGEGLKLSSGLVGPSLGLAGRLDRP